MLERFLQFDKQVLIFLNGLGTETWDSFWLFATKQFNWTPLFLLILFVLFRHLGWKRGLFLLFFTALLIAFTDQFTNLIRIVFKRLRPVNDPTVVEYLRIQIRPKNYSFTSGHATTSTAVAIFLIRVLKPYVKYIVYFLVFPLVFSYSRLYLGVHYLTDVVAGACIGITIAQVAFYIHRALEARFFSGTNA